MKTGKNRIVGQFTQFGRLSPFVCDTLQFASGDGDDGAVAWVEVHFYLIVDDLEVFQVCCFCKLIGPFHIDIIHQDVFILSD